MNEAQCLFCRIVGRTLPAEIVAEAEEFLAFKDINPQAPIHLLVIPKKHISKLSDLIEAQIPLVGELVQFANRLAHQQNLVKDGYRLVINCGAGAGQSVWHIHVHLMGGRTFQWPPG
ncbi:MAG: histidine triad nucleotide-binding protein [Nitrososphaera sp.]|nr:histidine triad nucleotide-binding protein [Nitrososphaera sp.]